MGHRRNMGILGNTFLQTNRMATPKDAWYKGPDVVRHKGKRTYYRLPHRFYNSAGLSPEDEATRKYLLTFLNYQGIRNHRYTLPQVMTGDEVS